MFFLVLEECFFGRVFFFEERVFFFLKRDFFF